MQLFLCRGGKSNEKPEIQFKKRPGFQIRFSARKRVLKLLISIIRTIKRYRFIPSNSVIVMKLYKSIPPTNHHPPLESSRTRLGNFYCQSFCTSSSDLYIMPLKWSPHSRLIDETDFKTTPKLFLIGCYLLHAPESHKQPPSSTPH